MEFLFHFMQEKTYKEDEKANIHNNKNMLI